MLEVSVADDAIIESGSAIPIALIKLELPVTEYLTPFDGGITVGGNEYRKGDLLAIGAFQLQRNFQNNQMNLLFAGKSYLDKFKNAGSLGIKVEVDLLLLAQDGSRTSVLQIYRGVSDSPVLSRLGIGRATTVTFWNRAEFQNRARHPRLSTPENHSHYDSNSNAFDVIHETDRLVDGWAHEIDRRR